MAIGDFFAEISAANTSLIIQPAASVVICVTSYANNLATGGGFQPLNMYDGAQYSGFSNGNATAAGADTLNMKVFATNTNYVAIWANGAGQHTAMTGVEVQ